MSRLNNNTDEIEIDLKKLYLALKKGKRWLIITPSIFVIIATIYVLLIAKPIYTSEAKILLAGSGNNQSSLIGLANQFGFSIPSSISGENEYLTPETLPEILKSRTLINSILFSEFVTEKNNQPETLLSIIMEPSRIATRDSNRLIDSGQKYITEKVIEVKQIKNTTILSLLFNSPDPILSAQIGRKVILELQKLQIDFNLSELIDQKEFIGNRLQEVEIELYKAESKLKVFREHNLQINLSPSLLLEQERLEREINIQTEIYISLKQQLEQIKINETKSITSVRIINEPSIPVERSKPKKKLIILLSGLIGFAFGGSISVIKFYKE